MCVLRIAGQGDTFRDERLIQVVQLLNHSAETDNLSGKRNELIVEDVVVDRVTNGSAEDTNRKGKSSYCGDKIVRTDNCRDDGARYLFVIVSTSVVNGL